jgi:omega-6 fatty acid desaturase (delta-12 desaturase)
MAATRAPPASPAKAATAAAPEGGRTPDAGADAKAPSSRAPSSKPPFTVKDLRRAIPPECFVRSLPRSAAYLAADLCVVATLFALSTLIPRAVDLLPAAPPPPPSSSSSFLSGAPLLAPLLPSTSPQALMRLAAGASLWCLYWFLQGAHCTGLWVTAHECGHGAFSDYPLVNDAVGYVVHTALLVPYYSWKHSHRRHHGNTGSAEHDEVFVPAWSPDERPLWGSGAYRLAHLAFQQLLGWPSYLLFNAGGKDYSRWASHFDPWSPVFSPRERAEVALSTAGVAAALSLLWSASRTFGVAAVVKAYVVPYFIVNWWLVMITFLQHTHPSLPHYAEGEWDWLRGALSTVDRSFGKYLDGAFHHIADTHVVHHLFSGLPHYNAERATEAVKGVLGEYYMRDGRNVWRALWEDTRDCCYASPDAGGGEGGGAAAKAGGEPARRGVLWYRSAVTEAGKPAAKAA